ncbi:reductive dehalogenase [Chloroflexota bacterium]
MKPRLTAIGADRYVVGQVESFDQKNEALKRSTWDPAMRDMAKPYYARFEGLDMPKEKEGYTLKELALEMASWHIALDFGSGQFTGGEGLEAWEAWPVGRTDTTRMPKELKLEVDSPAEAAKVIKKAAKLFGASLVGICLLDRRWLYSHSYHTLKKEHKPVEIGKEYNYVIVMAHEMDYDGIKQAPNCIADAAVGTVYSRMSVTGAMLAQYIRGLGYKAIPMSNDTATSIPLAIDAGLGELSRMGLLITPEYGPRVRLHKIFTDMPLIPDEPIDFGVWDFCMKCEKCARFCPGRAIMYGPPTAKTINICNQEGLLRWPLNAEKCFGFLSRNGTDCGVCIRVCPFNKPLGILHDWVRWGVKNTCWLDSLFIRAEDLLGYGKQAKTKYYWE